MKSKEERKDLLNKFTSHEVGDLESLKEKIQMVLDQKVITEEVLRELFSVSLGLGLVREKFLTRLMSLYKQGYTD